MSERKITFASDDDCFERSRKIRELAGLVGDRLGIGARMAEGIEVYRNMDIKSTALIDPAEVLELLEEVNREVKPIFDIYDNDYEPHEMPAHYPSPDGAADTFRKVEAMITKLKGEG